MKFLVLILTILFFNLSQTFATNNAFPYSFSYKKDLFLSLSGIGLLASGIELTKRQKSLSITDINNARKSEINFIDRHTVNFRYKTASISSDLGLLALSPAPFYLLFSKKIRNNALLLALMYAEGLLINTGTTQTFKGLFGRLRPYVYNDHTSQTYKLSEGKDARKSFFSGHTSHSFYSAVFTSKVFSDLYPNSKFKNLIWYSSVSLATLTGGLRILAGKHFLTDVLSGALCGIATGFLVPTLHKKNENSVKIIPIIGETKGIVLLFDI